MSPIEPVRLEVVVPLAPQEAFEHFTARMHLWWPLVELSISRTRARDCGVDPFPGGLVFETSVEGERIPWGTVLVWDPPHRLVCTWHPGREATTAQELELRFVADGDGTRVELEHRGWERLGDEARASREGYVNGWAWVVGSRYRESALATTAP